ncbi:nitrite reductase [NAD(P)H], small subunit [Burkholderia pseudomallei]|nr:nitrite reductase [NAD(P)H], small subunit [Burkholderia pseudomallei]
MSATQPEWIAVCRLDDIPPLGARVLTREAGTLSQGIVHGEQVTCPLHGFNVAFSSGCALPPDEGCTSVFSVKRDGDTVLLERTELATLGVDDAAQPAALASPGAAA